MLSLGRYQKISDFADDLVHTCLIAIKYLILVLDLEVQEGWTSSFIKKIFTLINRFNQFDLQEDRLCFDSGSN